MKKTKFFFIVLIATMLPFGNNLVRAAIVGDIFAINGVYYVIHDVEDATVHVVGTYTSGSVSIPNVVKDSVNVEWQVIGTEHREGYTWEGVTELTLPNSITNIGLLSFQNIEIQTLQIPASVISIADRCFMHAENLESITVADGNTHYKSVDGVLFSYDGTEMIAYPRAKSGTSYEVPEGTTVAEPQSFCRNANLKSVTLPKSFASLPIYYDAISNAYGVNAFFACTSLETISVTSGNTNFSANDGVLYNVNQTELIYFPIKHNGSGLSFTIPSSVTSIAAGAFYRARLKTIDLGNVMTIGDFAFKRCPNLTSVTIPSSVTSIKSGVFAGDINCTSFKVASGNKRYKIINDCIYTSDGDTLIAYPMGNTQEEYTISDGTKYLESESFYWANNLETVNVAADVKRICRLTFYNCENLKTINFASNALLEEIDSAAFRECVALKSISLPKSLKNIHFSAFIDNSSLVEVSIEDGSTLQSIGERAFMGCNALTSFTFQGSTTLTTIDAQAFFSCRSLVLFTIPSSVNYIGDGAFNGCTSLASVTFTEPTNVTVLNEGVFQNCGLTSFTIPESIVEIKQSAFNSCSKLPNITIPAATTSVDPRAFLFCSSLTAINVDDNNTVYSDCDGCLLSKDKQELVTFPAGKANKYFTLLPPSLTKLGNYSFYYCKQLENVCIPKKVTEIGDYAFDLCTNLTAIAFLADDTIAVNNVGKDAFFISNISREDITLYVRNGKEAEYVASSLWSTFGGIKTSFISDNKEYLPMSNVAVNMLNSTDDVHTLVIPETVSDSEGNTYDVRVIGDYAFEENTSTRIKEVVLKGAVGYVGARAFLNANQSIENVFFVNKESDGGDGVSSSVLCTKRFELEGLTDDNGKDYNEFTSTQNIYVRKSLEETFKSNCPAYTDQITYKIPFTQKLTFGTFAREFDTDFSDFGLTGDNIATTSGEKEPIVIAYTGYKSQSKDEDGTINIIMTSIFLGDDEKDGVYVPANTGVLLRTYNTSLTSKGTGDSYYRIGENDINGYTETNCMKGQVIDEGVVEAESGVTRCYVYNNQLRLITSSKTMPVHKAYLQIDEEIDSNAKIVMDFGEQGGTTSISLTELDTLTDGKIFDLQGRRVSTPSKGIYIKNGKKILIK